MRRYTRGVMRPIALALLAVAACTPQTSLGDRAPEVGGSGSGGEPVASSTSTGSPERSSTTVMTDSATDTSDGSDGMGGSETTAGVPFGVVGFRLADADADLLLGPLFTGQVVDPADYGGAELSLAAETLPVDVGSVEFFVDDQQIRIENIVPFTLGGNIEFDIGPWSLDPGTHTVRAVPYALDNAMGEQGAVGEVTFELL